MMASNSKSSNNFSSKKKGDRIALFTDGGQDVPESDSPSNRADDRPVVRLEFGGDNQQLSEAVIARTTLTPEELRKREALLSRAAGMARLGWWDYDMTTGRLEWSDETIEIYGVTRESFGGRLDDFVALVHPQDLPGVLAKHGENLATGEPLEQEYRIRRPDGEQRLIWDRGETFFAADGKPIRRSGVVIDITERKLAETQMLKLSAAVDQAPDRVVITDRNGRIEYVNQAFQRATGYQSGEVIGRTPAILKSGAHDAKFYTRLWKTILAGERFQAEFTNRRRDGGLLIEEQTIIPLRNERQEITHFVSTGRDISERKRMDVALRESEARHRLLFESNPQPILVFDLETLAFLAVNQAALALYGYTEEEFRGMTIKEIRPEEEIPKLMAAITQCITDSSELINFGIWCHKLKSGRLINVEIRFHRITYAGRPAAMILPIDMTERCEAERSLRESEERFRQLAENVKEVFWIQDLTEDRLLYVSPAFERVWGRTYQSMQSSEDWLNTIHPEDRPGIIEYLRKQRSEGCHEHTYRITRPDGEVRWIHNRAYPVFEDGQPTRIVGTSEDVTERVASEGALRQSEERFRLLSKATNDAVWDWDVVSDRLWWSEGFETLFGFQRNEIESGIEGWVKRVHPDDRDRMKAETQYMLGSTKSNWDSQYRFLRSDGSFAWVRDRAHLIRDEKGHLIRMIGGMTDITERKLAEERISEQAMLLDIAQDGILVKDLSHKVQYWNKGAERIFGWTTEEVISRSTLDLFHADAAQLECASKAVLEVGEWKGDLQARRKDGREITINMRCTLVREKTGEPKAVFSIISDITESRKLEKQLLRAQRMESIGTLAGGIAHDLNNVLAPILMSIEVLKDDLQDSSCLSLLDTIESSAQRGAELVKQVLGFARGMDGARIQINPTHIAREIQRIVRDTFPKNISFELSVRKEVWCLRGDPTQLHQVLMNLCVNARDAMVNGGKLRLSLENVELDEVFTTQHPQATCGSHVLLTVTDTGTGITKVDLDRIFEPFFTTKPPGEGTGLGLSTTLAIVKSHGGFIDVSSERGRGSTFKIYLPAESVVSGREGTPDLAKLAKGNGEKILVVDDESGVREIAKAALEKNGYQALVAKNGAEAVAAYARDPQIALVLVDMTMPVMDGVATIIALRQLNPQLGIIGSSGVASSEGAAKPLAAGANQFISKPYTAENLLLAIRETLLGTERLQ